MSESPEKIAFENVASQSVPAFGVMEVTGSIVEDGVAFLTCAQVGSMLGTEFAVNGPSVVRSGEKGICFRHGDLPVAYDAGTPQPGEGWGVRAGQWTLSKGYPSIVAVHGIQNAPNHILYGTLTPLSAAMGSSGSDLAPRSGDHPGTGIVSVSVWDGAQFSPADPAMSFSGYNTAVTPVRSGVLTRFVASNGIFVAATPENYVYHVTLGTSIAAGASATITLPDGRSVSATNWSSTDYNSGDKVTVYEDLSNGSFYAIKSGGDSLVRFELTSDLTYAGGSTTGNANILVWDSGSGQFTPTGATITVWDFATDSWSAKGGGYGVWSGKGPRISSPARAGYQGWATWRADAAEYEIVWLENQANLIAFRLVSQLKTSDDHQTVAVTAYWNGRDPDPAASGVDVYNLATDYATSGVYKYSGDANALGYAEWNPKIGFYKIIALEGDGRRWVLWKNNNAGTCPANGVFYDTGISNELNGHTNTRVVMTGDKPGVIFKRGFWVNGYAAVASGAIGVCCSSESPCEVLVNTVSVAPGQSVGPTPNQWVATVGFPGMRVIGLTGGGGPYALVAQEPILQLLVKLTQAVQQTTGTTAYKIYTGTPGAETDGGWTSVPTAYTRSGFIENGAWAFLLWLNSEWELVPRPETMFLAKLTNSLSQGSFATATIYAGTPNSESSTPISTVVYDWLMKSGSSPILAGKKVICKYINGNAYVVDAECA